MIHESIYFSKEEILRRAKKYEFPNAIAVEYFLWDCELTAQLQSVCEDLILKGGAATQLHLPLEKQRGSKDVDMVTSLEEQDIQGIIDKVSEKFAGCATYTLYEPKNPLVNLPLKTYYAHVNSEIDPQRIKLNVKLDFICNCPKLPSISLNAVQTYALEAKNIICSTAGALAGDKLLSLAEGSIGLDLDIDFVKQVYDVDALLENCDVSTNFVNDFLTSIRNLVPIESSYRKINITPKDALCQIIQSMERYSLVDINTGGSKIIALIQSFQQFYVNTRQRKPYYEWSTKALRIRFLAILACDLVDEKRSIEEVKEIIGRCKRIEKSLEEVIGNKVASIKTEILKVAESKAYYYSKLLKGKPLTRVFWQIVSPDNLDSMNKIV